jgi:hypothetical protein
MVVANSCHDVCIALSSIHVCKLFLQAQLKRLDFQANVSDQRAHAFDAFCLYVFLRGRSQVLWYDVKVR